MKINLPGEGRRKSIASWIGTLGLALAALGLGASTAAINSGIILLVVGALLVIDDVYKSLKPADYRLILTLFAFILLHTIWAVYAFQADPSTASGGLRELLKISGIPALAAGWWMLHGRLSFQNFLLLLMSGIFIGVSSSINYQHIPDFSFRIREQVADMNPNELGFLSGALLLVSTITLLPRETNTDSKLATSIVWYFFLIFSLLLSFWLIFQSQSRAIMIAAAGSLTLILAIKTTISIYRKNQFTRNLILIGVALLLLISITSYTPLGKMFSSRFDSLENSLYLFTNIDSESIPPSGFKDKIRLWLWRDGISRAKEAPFLGHGPGTPSKFISESKFSEISHHKHYHNFWLNLLVSIGAIGTLGFLWLFLGLMGRSAQSAIKLDLLVGWVSLAFWVYFLVISLVQLRINHASGQAFVILTSGMSLYSLFSSREEQDSS